MTRLILTAFPILTFLAASLSLSLIEKTPVDHQVQAVQRHPSSINRAALALSQPSRVFYGSDGEPISPELILLFHQMQSEQKPIDVAEYIPMTMQPSSDSTLVFSQIADRGFAAYFSRPEVRESFIGQQATQVEEKMKAEVLLPSAEREHKLNFNLQAFQATARIEYTGFTKAAIQYRATQSQLGFELSEVVASGKELVVSHSVQSENRISELNLRWNF